MQTRSFFVVVATLCTGGLLFATASQQSPNKPTTQQPKPAGSGDPNFDTMMSVLTHPRCVNCHPGDGIPKQGDDSHPHYFGIVRGKKNQGFESTNCNTCHQTENNAYSGVPGGPEWSLAPASMQWEGLSKAEIARSMLDPKRNGNRTPDKVMHHLTEHALVLWAWDPGVDADGIPRETPPVPKDEYINAVKQWFADGHRIPD